MSTSESKTGEGWEEALDPPALLAPWAAGTAISPLAATGNMCCTDMAEKGGEYSSKNPVQNELL